MKTTPISIQVREDATRVALTTARSVPLPLMKPREEELKKMERHGIVTSETEPADWVSALAPVGSEAEEQRGSHHSRLQEAEPVCEATYVADPDAGAADLQAE